MLPYKESLLLHEDNIGGMIYFKTDAERFEFLDDRLNENIRFIILGLCCLVRLYYERSAVITEIWRNDVERHLLYPDPNSVEHNRIGKHEQWKAVDIRVWNLSPIVIKVILEYFIVKNIPKFTGLLIKHMVKGNVSHFHLQVD